MIKIISTIFFVLYLLAGCSSESYMECNSKSNKRIIKDILQKQQKNIQFTSRIYNIYNKNINKETQNRSCHATIEISLSGTLFNTEIDYDVIKLLDSDSSHQVVIRNYPQTVGNLFFYEIEPHVRKMSDLKLEKEKGFNSIEEKSKENIIKDCKALKKSNDTNILYSLDSFIVNFKTDVGRRYLKATLSLELSGKEVSLELDLNLPVIRDRIIRILTSKTLEEISSKKGKRKISKQIQDALNSIIHNGKVRGVYFTEFVIQ